MDAAIFPRTDPSPRSFASAHRRRVAGGALALVASLCAHAVMAAIAGATLWSLGARERPPASGVEIEIAAAPAPVIVDAPAPPAGAAPAPLPTRRPARRIEPHPALGAPSRAAPSPTPAAPPPAATAPAVSDGRSPVLFAMSAGTVAGRASSPVSPVSPARVATAGGAGVDPVLAAAAVDVPATLLSHPPALYPPAARRAVVEGDVAVEIVVGADGVVSDARALSDHGYGLDAAALQAVRAYRFSPARRAGRPVRVRMRWTVQFRLR